LSRFVALPPGPEFLAKVDDVRHSYLAQFRGDQKSISAELADLIKVVQDAPDFPAKGRVLDRLAGL
jgi:hypothetical protein